MDWQASAAKIYWAFFVMWFFLVAIWESRAPRVPLLYPTGRRWRAHGVLFAICILSTTVFLRLTPVAADTQEQFKATRRKLAMQFSSVWGDLLRVQKQQAQLAALTFLAYLKRMAGLSP